MVEFWKSWLTGRLNDVLLEALYLTPIQSFFTDRQYILGLTMGTYMRNGLSIKPVSFWPSGSVKETLSLFLVHSESSLVISIFFIFWQKNGYGLNACYPPQWSSLRGFKMVRAGVSTMKFKEANHDEPPQCTSLIGAGMSHAFRPVHLKKNEKITRENPVKIEKKMLILNQMVKKKTSVCKLG